MERNSVKQLNMVSRLPKFASRPSGNTITPLPQGSSLPVFSAPVSSVVCRGAPLAGQNSLTRVPSLKWKKSEEGKGNKIQCTESLEEEASVTVNSQPTVQAIKKPSPAAQVKFKSAVPTAQSSSTRTVPQPNKSSPRMAAPKHLSTGHPLYNGKAALNRVSGVNGRCGSGSSGSGMGNASQQKTLENNPFLFSDLRSASKENIVRSQSFTHFKRGASSTDPPITRSFSFNKATELAKELPRPLAQSPVARSPLIQTNPVLAEEKSGKFGITRCSVTTSSDPIPVVATKKSLLPNFSSNKPSALSYRPMRPPVSTYRHHVISGTVQNEGELNKKDIESAQSVENSSEQTSKAESTETSPDETPYEAKEVQNSFGQSLKVLENMSLSSSSSSLEHNDTSEEYMDDFDNLGNGGEILLLSVHKEDTDVLGPCGDDNALITQCNEDSAEANLHSFFSETVDWAEMGLTAGKGDFEKSLSPVCDFPHGSSLDLSPSDSSGGTYMWDEEGLDALGGSGPPCGSFDSDLNSMDILNNLEHVESCDLEEDDLMLDLDLSEDVSLLSDTDGMASYECSENGGHPNQRRRRPHCWRTRDPLCCENRSGILQPFEGCQELGLERSGSNHVTLDEFMLKHMVQDCSSVKAQLLQLKTLLQMEADGSDEEISEAHTSESTDQSLLDEKVVLLLQEVQELKNELQMKDKMITELSQQCSPVEVPQCHCRQESEGHSRSAELQDNSTQTPWRAHAPQILQAPTFLPSKLHTNGSLSSSAHTKAHCDNVDAQLGDRPLTAQSSSPDPQSPVTVESDPNSTVPMLVIPANSTTAFSRTLQNSDPELSVMSSNLQTSKPAIPPASANPCCRLERGIQNQPLARSSFSALQPPNYIKRATTFIKPQEAQRVSMLTGALSALGNTGLSRTRHQLLPAHRISCINPAGRASVHTIPAATVYFPQNQGFRLSQSYRETEIGLPRARASLQFNRSRLPKPKTQ